MESDRYKKGIQKIYEIDGEEGTKVLESLEKFFPELARFIIAYSFGDIYSLAALPPKEKEIAVIAALAALGTARPQLKIHLHGALNTGNSVEEVKEVLLHISGYAGFPAALNAMSAFMEIAAEHNALRKPSSNEKTIDNGRSRYERGSGELEALYPGQIKILSDKFENFCPDLARYIIEFGYGDIYSRKIISKRERQIATIAALTAMGTASEQLSFHIEAGINVGLTVIEIKEIMLLMTVFAGFPAAINGSMVLKSVIQKRTE